MSPEAVRQTQRFLQVHFSASFEPGGTRQRLLRDVDLQRISLQFDDGEATAVDRDAVTDLHVGQIQRRTAYPCACTSPARRERADFPYRLDDPCEHMNLS